MSIALLPANEPLYWPAFFSRFFAGRSMPVMVRLPGPRMAPAARTGIRCNVGSAKAIEKLIFSASGADGKEHITDSFPIRCHSSPLDLGGEKMKFLKWAGEEHK